MKIRLNRAMAWWHRHMPSWLLTIVTVAASLLVTLCRPPMPEEDIPSIPGLDKVVHALMCAAVTAAAWVDLRLWLRRRPAAWQTSLCSLGAILLGGAIEIAQGAMHMGRAADFYDFVADTIGALAAFAILLRYGK